MSQITDEIAKWPMLPLSRDDTRRFQSAPCFICGYNGGGYFQPETHSCAERYHSEPESKPDALEARLRTADALIERVADVSCDCDVIGCEHDDARAYLAAREGER